MDHSNLFLATHAVTRLFMWSGGEISLQALTYRCTKLQRLNKVLLNLFARRVSGGASTLCGRGSILLYVEGLRRRKRLQQ